MCARPAVGTARAALDGPVRGFPRGLAVWFVLLAALALAAAVSVVVLVRQNRWHEDRERSAAAALALARVATPRLLSYDHQRLDADVAAAAEYLTDPYRARYRWTTLTELGPRARRHGAVVRGRLAAASIVRATPGRVILLIFVDQTTVRDGVSPGWTDRVRARMTVIRRPAGWRVAELEVL